MSRYVDKHSPEFTSRLVSGKSFSKVVLTTRSPSGRGAFTVTMKDVLVSSYQILDGGGGDPVEYMIFDIGSIELKHEAPAGQA